MAVWFVCKTFSWEVQDVHGKTEDILKEKGIKVYEFERNDIGEYICKENLPNSFYDYVILRGPIKFVNVMYRRFPYINFLTHFKDGFHCTQYLSKFPSEWFLNSDGYFSTYGLFKRKKVEKSVFIRPNSPYKTFTGLTITPENFYIEMNSLNKISNVADEEIILISENKMIDSEFRYVICNKEVIGYSEYRWDNVLDIRRDTLPECLELAEIIAKYHTQIDDLYVVDIGMVDGQAKVIEFNSFASSGLYAIDQHHMIDKIENYVNKMDYE